jgi:hypothetical protein
MVAIEHGSTGEPANCCARRHISIAPATESANPAKSISALKKTAIYVSTGRTDDRTKRP